MILIPQGKKIVLIAVSLFITTFSLVFFLAGGSPGHNDDLKASAFGTFFEHGGAYETSLKKDTPVIALEVTGTIVDVNELFTEKFGYTLQDLASKSFFSLIAADDLPEFAPSFTETSKSKNILVNAGPYHIMSNDGSNHVVLITLEVVVGERQGSEIIILSLKDITDSVDTKEASEGNGKTIKDMENSKEGKNRIIVEKTV